LFTLHRLHFINSMMDANELKSIPNDTATVIEPEPTLESTSAATEGVQITYVPKQTKEEVINRLLELSLDPCNAEKQELDMLKQNFYKLLKAEQEQPQPNLDNTKG